MTLNFRLFLADWDFRSEMDDVKNLKNFNFFGFSFLSIFLVPFGDRVK